MTTPDKIHCVIAGNKDGTIVGIGGPFGEEWKLIHDAIRPANIEIPGSLIAGPQDQDTLKITQLTGIVSITVAGDIVGGSEDCIDVTRCNGHILIDVAGVLMSGGKHVAIIKGQSSGVYIRGKIAKHGKDTDIELGGFYGGGDLPLMNGKTTDTTLALTCADRINIRQFRSDAPKIANSQAYKHDRLYEFFYPIWLWFRERGIGK